MVFATQAKILFIMTNIFLVKLHVTSGNFTEKRILLHAFFQRYWYNYKFFRFIFLQLKNDCFSRNALLWLLNKK